MSKETFQERFLDLVGELGNITFGSATTALNVIVNQHIDITSPKATIVSKEELIASFPNPHVLVDVDYSVGLEGQNILLLKPKDAAIIADLMMFGDGTGISDDPELSEMEISAISEAMNQMMGAASIAMSDFLGIEIDICPPEVGYKEISHADMLEELLSDDYVIKVSFDLIVGDLIHSNLIQVINIPFAKQLANELLGI